VVREVGSWTALWTALSEPELIEVGLDRGELLLGLGSQLLLLRAIGGRAWWRRGRYEEIKEIKMLSLVKRTLARPKMGEAAGCTAEADVGTLHGPTRRVPLASGTAAHPP